MTGQPDRTEATGQSGHESKDTTAGKDSWRQEVLSWTVATEQPGQEGRRLQPGHDSPITGRPSQHSNDRTARAGQPGLDNCDMACHGRTVTMRHLGQDN
jgi:hypothetical protein